MSITEAQAKSVVDDIIFRSVGIGVSDLKKSADFYSRVLGMKQVGTITLDYMDEIILAYPADNFARGSRLVLMHWKDGSKRDYKNLPGEGGAAGEGCKGRGRSHPRRRPRGDARADQEQGQRQHRRLRQGS